MAKDTKYFDPPDEALGRSVGRGAVATGGAQAVKLGCQIVSVIVLSRLLQPGDFGIVAMTAPVIAFVGLFQDLGLTQATVQKKHITHRDVNSMFWINMIVSALLGVLMILIAPFVASFYSEPQVAPLVTAMSLQLIILGAGAQHHALLSRRMEFGRLAALECVAAVIGLAVAIAWAWVWHTYWALFIGGITTIAITTLGCWLSSHWLPGRPRWAGGTGGMINFGAGITGFNFANYFSRNLDQILIGRRYGNQDLGLYDRANRLLLLPLQQIINPLSRVMIPALSRMVEEPDRYRRAYLRVVPLLLFIALPAVAVAIAMADRLIPLALGEQWRGAIMIFQALGFASLLQPLNNPSGWLFISQGRSMEFMRWGIFAAAVTSVALLVGLPYGVFGVALAYAISEYVRTPLLWLYVGRKGPVKAGDIMVAALPFVLGAHISVAALWALKSYLAVNPIIALLVASVFSYAIVAGIAILFASGRGTLSELSEAGRKLVASVFRRVKI